MSKSKFDKIWNLLSNNTIETDGELPDDLACVICKKLCVEPYAALCGCQFCYRCIKSHLVNNKQLCPGNKDECRIDYLELNRNVLRDLKTAHILTKVVVKCPNIMCDFKTKLENLRKHLKKCKARHSNGSTEDSDKDKKIIFIDQDSKLSINSVSLITIIHGISNDVRELQRSLEIKDEEIDKLNEQLNMKETTITAMTLKLDRLIERVDNLEQNNLIKETEINEIREDFNKREIEMKTLRKRQSLCSCVFEYQDENVTDVISNNAYREIVKSNIEETVNMTKSMNAKIDDFFFNKEKNFYWTIDNFSKKQKAECKLRSAPFYKNSFKMHLFVSFNEGHLRLLCHVLKGEFDAYIDWPMKLRVTLSILNQDTQQIHMSNVFQMDSCKNKSVFNRPQSSRNEGFGNNKFIPMSDLINIKGLLRNDCVVLACLVDDYLISK